MQFWSDMLDKHGFNDGDAEPGGMSQYREAYLMVMNTLLELHGSTVRYVAYDRPGMHNSCMIAMTHAPGTNSAEPPEPDRAHVRAFEQAHDLDVDRLITVPVEVDTETIDLLLAELKEKMGKGEGAPE